MVHTQEGSPPMLLALLSADHIFHKLGLVLSIPLPCLACLDLYCHLNSLNPELPY